MRINPEVKQKRIDMNGEVRIPNCEPQQLKVVAERLMKMLLDREEELDATPYQYNTVTELDRKIILHYWRRYDGLQDTALSDYDFQEWWLKDATEPDLITRSRRWLLSHRYIFLKQGVEERRQEASENFSRAVRSK